MPKTPDEVAANLRKQKEVERIAWCDARTAAAKSGDATPSPPCVKSLTISLFFDGTNNHEPSDKRSAPPTTTNVARLFHASLGSEENSLEQKEGYYRYYMQGVGTEFKEIKEYTPQSAGLTMAVGGENRINWGITRLLDAIGQACGKAPLHADPAYDLVQAMGITRFKETFTLGLLDGNARRKAALQPELDSLQRELIKQQERGTAAEIKAIRLFVYGFSRGAAQARTFANWLEQLTRVEEDGQVRHLFAGLPISIEFLGLFDTVASVGFAYLAPFAAGHMGWADDTMRLPDSTTFLRRCVHLVAAHEQRGCFPLDSIRRKDDPKNELSPSRYRVGTYEYIYPGVHSDVGGGYPPGDQGKAREGGHQVLSQIALHHMYSEAFKAGAPLQVPDGILNAEQKKLFPWLVMSGNTFEAFDVGKDLIDRFNTWLSQLSKGPLETVMANEAELITAWRIDRFANQSMHNQPFYKHASGGGGNSQSRDMTKEERDAFAHLHELQMEQDAVARGAPPRKRRYTSEEEQQQAEARAANREAEAKRIKEAYEARTGSKVTFNTHKDYDPPLEKRQLHNAALDFRRDYIPEWNMREGDGTGEGGFQTATIVNALLGGLVYLTNEQDEAGEYERMRTLGTEIHAKLFRDINTPADEQAALVIALFDEQVHDSRAWFMNSALNGREVFSDYFRYRAVFFDDESNKRISLLARAGQVIGVGIALGSIGLSIKRRDPRYLLGLALPSLGTPVLRGKVGMPEIQAFDSLTGIVLPMLEGVEAVRAFTKDTGSIVQLANTLPLPVPLTEKSADTPELQSILKAAEAAKAIKAANDADDMAGLIGQAMDVIDKSVPKPGLQSPGWLDQAKGMAKEIGG
ncbi:T6SS phospholipase effector Tle1-like catalytic domain-containing protein [Pseudomonas sp.]|uniref:T6SS phospholipase effector Tle1-like catalytic domain-containing protein n=1 Tax=Pseudomonas sp. TaxID=306 RepID=UPI003D145AFC